MHAKVKTLDYYFSAVGQKAALEKYCQFAGSSGWSVPNKMNLYEASLAAFQGDFSREQRLKSFQQIYENLRRHWQVFRSSRGDTKIWDLEKAFDVINAEFTEFGWGSGITMISLPGSGRTIGLQTHLHAMRGIKSNSNYPTMTVSKFLHFYNPRLFPIFDTQVVWNRVFRRFRKDYSDFCDNGHLDAQAGGANFLGNYICWGGSLVKKGGPAFMQQFVGWIQDELAPKQFRRLEPVLGTLYATAFEFTSIGAAVAEGC